MNRLDKMKANIIDQINNLTPEQFEIFIELISGDYTVAKEKIPFDASDMFTCKKCFELFGDCNGIEDDSLCGKRFTKYAMENI